MTAPQTSSPTFYTYQLDNGLQILGQRMPELESVSTCFFVRTGSRDEHDPALYGVSHFLEHMVFKGTAKRPSEEIDLEFNRIGAENNAFTSYEETVYYARVLQEYLPRALDLLSDMMRPKLDAQEFDMERNVILEEIARSEDVPSSQAFWELSKAFFAGTSLGHDVLGTKGSISAMTVEQMRAYHDRRYAANNMILAVAGNFEWEQVLDLAHEKCGSWQRGEFARHAEPIAPSASKSMVIIKRPQKQQIFMLALPSVSHQDPDLYAAYLASMILGGSTGSRFFWNIFQKGLAESASIGPLPFDNTGIMIASVSTTPDHAPAVLELVREELQGMQQYGATEDELNRAKTKLISSTVLSGDSSFSRMRALPDDWVSKDRLYTLDEEVQLIESVQLADIRRVLDRYPLTGTHVLTTYGPLDAAAFGLQGVATEVNAEASEEDTAGEGSAAEE